MLRGKLAFFITNRVSSTDPTHKRIREEGEFSRDASGESLNLNSQIAMALEEYALL